MKYISKYKSPNYNSRKNSKIKVIVIHYTALKNTSEAISYLCKKENKVSAHYLISQNGDVYNLVNDTLRAWHAGQSSYEGLSDCNDFSIGIELEGSDTDIFTDAQYDVLTQLTQTLLSTYPSLSTHHITGHSDIAPGRKTDPGPSFDWRRYKAAIA